jgi:hypothetical protein
MDLKELREKGKSLNIPHAHVMGEEKLTAKIAEKEAEMAPKEPEVVAEEPKTEEPPVEYAVPTPGPTMPDVENPDAEGLAQRQADASQEARLKALEEALLMQQEENENLRNELTRQGSEVAKKPTREVPERPNPNTMVYFKDDKGKICHKQVSFAEAKILLEKDEYGKSPAYFQ